MPDWNTVYAEKAVANAMPAEVLTINEHLLSTSGNALDYASGLAGSGTYLAAKGYQVSAWDLSETAVDKINEYAKTHELNIQAECIDLENNSPEIKNKFDLVVVSCFLHRETLRFLYETLKKDGLLFYQTFSGLPFNGQGPSRESFRLRKNELLGVFSDMQILFYREDDESSTGENARQGLTYFVAKK